MPLAVVRVVKPEDASGIAALLPDLGYAGSSQDVSRRLKKLAEWPENEVLVAVFEEDIVGLCHLQGVPLLATDGYVEIQAFVVSRHAHRKGVGALLVGHALAWSRQHGYSRTRLRSGLHREEAHLFYESQGFIRSKASYAFEFTHASSDA